MLKFKTFGCGSAIASSSLITEWVKGKVLIRHIQLKIQKLQIILALPPVKIHCSVLAEDAIKAAIADYKDKNKKMITVTSSAIHHIKELISQEKNLPLVLRLVLARKDVQVFIYNGIC